MSTLYVVATPIGNLSDLSSRAIEILGSVSVILCEDTRTSGILLSKLGIKKELVSYHKFNERERARAVIERMERTGEDFALISDAGTPCISDPGVELVRECAECGIEVVGVPGASATVTAMSVAGFDGNFAFLGFPPRKRSEIREFFTDNLPTGVDNHVFYESPRRIVDTLDVLAEVMPEAQICVCNDLTKKFERKYRGTVSSVLDSLKGNPNAELGEYVAVLHARSERASQEKLPAECAIFMELLNGAGLSEARDALAGGYSRNELYSATLKIKKFLEKE